jgi:hypothetical protein
VQVLACLPVCLPDWHDMGRCLTKRNHAEVEVFGRSAADAQQHWKLRKLQQTSSRHTPHVSAVSQHLRVAPFSALLHIQTHVVLCRAGTGCMECCCGSPQTFMMSMSQVRPAAQHSTAQHCNASTASEGSRELLQAAGVPLHVLVQSRYARSCAVTACRHSE